MPLSECPLQQVTLADGAKITYVRSGQGSPLVFLHGAFGDYRSWDPQWDFFTQYFDCISISCRFSYPNGNDMPAPNHSALADAEDVIALLDILGIQRANFVGSSYGGFATLGICVAVPDRVIRAVAVEPPMMKYAEMYDDTAPIAAAFRAATVVTSRAAFERGDDVLGAILLTGGIANTDPATIPPAVMERRHQNMMAGRRIALSSDEFPLIDPNALRRLNMPILLATGANTGPIFKAIYSGITRNLPQAEQAVFHGVGHGVSGDKPAEFNQRVYEFLTR